MIDGVFATAAIGSDHLNLKITRRVVCLCGGIDAVGAGSVGEIPLPADLGGVGDDETALMLQRAEDAGLCRAAYVYVWSFDHFYQIVFDDRIAASVLCGYDQLHGVVSSRSIKMRGARKG